MRAAAGLQRIRGREPLAPAQHDLAGTTLRPWLERLRFVLGRFHGDAGGRSPAWTSDSSMVFFACTIRAGTASPGRSSNEQAISVKLTSVGEAPHLKDPRHRCAAPPVCPRLDLRQRLLARASAGIHLDPCFDIDPQRRNGEVGRPNHGNRGTIRADDMRNFRMKQGIPERHYRQAALLAGLASASNRQHRLDIFQR